MSAAGPMRVAILDHYSAGGVSRFLFALVAHLADLKPEVSFSYFVSETNVVRDDLVATFASHANVTIVPIRSAAPTAPPSDVDEPQVHGVLWRTAVGLLKKMPRVHAFLRDGFVSARESVSSAGSQPWYRYQVDEDVRARIAQHDVLYIGWPFYVEPFDAGVPLVATFHDFHFKHFPESYVPEQLATVERQTPEWLRRCTIAVTSTEYIKSELLHYYGPIAPQVDVVFIAPYGFDAPDQAVIEDAIARYAITPPYVLYSGARTAHKNVAGLVRAVALLRDAGTPVQLVITGHDPDIIGTDRDSGPDDPVHLINAAIEQTELARGSGYRALGYVSNEDVDALTVGANAVVSASLYEAGCGPALDAWQAGVPVAFSDIPPFVEQTQRFGVEAHVFDPYDPADIAKKLHAAVFDVADSRAMAQRSRDALARYTWEDAARGYWDVLARAAGGEAAAASRDAREGESADAPMV